MNFTRKDKHQIKEEVIKLIEQHENSEKDQDLQFLESEMAKLFIANPNEADNEEHYPAKWLFDEFQSLDETTGIGYFVSISSGGFVPGVLVKQNNEVTIKAWPALFSVMGTEGVIEKLHVQGKSPKRLRIHNKNVCMKKHFIREIYPLFLRKNKFASMNYCILNLFLSIFFRH